MPQAAEPRSIVVTGANSGIGFAACGSLSDAGHHVHLVCRTMAKAERACQQLMVRPTALPCLLKDSNANSAYFQTKAMCGVLPVSSWVQETRPSMRGSVTPHECELGSTTSIRRFASAWSGPIDVLCLNAGAQFVGQEQPKRTEEGWELTVGVNHLGHFLLANLLLPCLEQSSKQPRLVVTASEVRWRARAMPHRTESSACGAFAPKQSALIQLPSAGSRPGISRRQSWPRRRTGQHVGPCLGTPLRHGIGRAI